MSSCCWLKTGPSLSNGIKVVNGIESIRFHHFAKRILLKLTEPTLDIFTTEEFTKLQNIFKMKESDLILAIKTTHYLLKRMTKFIFKPVQLQGDLLILGLDEEKATTFVKVWTDEIKYALEDLSTDDGQVNDLQKIEWELCAQLSSDLVKKSVTQMVHLKLKGASDHSSTNLELSQSSLHTLFLQIEAIQAEIDSLK